MAIGGRGVLILLFREIEYLKFNGTLRLSNSDSERWNFSLMFSLNSVNLMTKIFVITVKGLEPATSCVRHQDTTRVPAGHM